MTSHPTLRAIETNYAGCRFRSRLEARWAVFFDTLSARWEYEPGGVTVDGRPYLPDFYLPEHQFYVEVKGDASQIDDDYETMLKQLVLNSKDTRGLIVLGPIPDVSDRRGVLHPSFLRRSVDTGTENDDRVTGVMLCSSYFLLKAYVMPLAFRLSEDPVQPHSVGYVRLLPSVEAAYVAARSARFEHGESGR